MTFEKLANIVADSFYQTMQEEGFETFDEMKNCYWWTAKEIKEEVDYIIRDITGAEAYIDELDGSLVFCYGMDMEYRKFATMWRKALKKMAS